MLMKRKGTGRIKPLREVLRIPLPGTSLNKLENGTLWRMCPMTLARRHAR